MEACPRCHFIGCACDAIAKAQRRSERFQPIGGPGTTDVDPVPCGALRELHFRAHRALELSGIHCTGGLVVQSFVLEPGTPSSPLLGPLRVDGLCHEHFSFWELGTRLANWPMGPGDVFTVQIRNDGTVAVPPSVLLRYWAEDVPGLPPVAGDVEHRGDS